MSGTASAADGGASPDDRGADGNKPPTVAAFSPDSSSFSHNRQRSTILVHQKSPLLLATPPQVTRALAYSHPFITPLNKLAGLLSWTTGDPWESFLMVAFFWFTVLYGGFIIRWTGPLLLVTFLIVGMYLRRYSPLSSTGWSGEKQKGQTPGHKRDSSEANIKHRKSLDEILATLQTFTTRCNILLEPFLRLTDFLSTQQTATSATTQPALTTLFIRIMIASPFWWGLALPPSPIRILTTRRICLIFGTIILSWHSRPARITRTILWRSHTVRWICQLATGLDFGLPASSSPVRNVTSSQHAAALATKAGDEGIRFTFTLFENQRRWLGIGWTASMLAYERGAWTDEHLNMTQDPQHFQLPEVEGGIAKWRWAEGSEWHVETSPAKGGTKSQTLSKDADEEAWIYYDNKWRDGRRGQDGWGRYTRRRKWIRDAELVDVSPEEQERAQEIEREKLKQRHAVPGAETGTTTLVRDNDTTTSSTIGPSVAGSNVDSPTGQKRRSGWFQRKESYGTTDRKRATSSASMSGASAESTRSRAAVSEDDVPTLTARLKTREAEWGLGDDVSMALG